MGSMCTAFSQGVIVGLTIYLPLYYEIVHKFSASDSGLGLIPIIVMSTPGSIVAGHALMYLDHYKRVPIVGLLFSITCSSVLVWNPAMSPLAVAALMSVVAFGIGMTYPVGTVSIQNSVSRYQVGAAMGAMNFFRGLTAAFIVAVMGAIVLAAARARAHARGGPAVADHRPRRGRRQIWLTFSAAYSQSGCCACHQLDRPHPYGGTSAARAQRGYPAAGRVARMSQRVRASAAR